MGSIARIAFILIICALLLNGCYESDAKLLELRRYTDGSIVLFGKSRSVRAASKWHDGKIQYQIVVIPFDTELMKINSPGAVRNVLSVRFLDADGFVIKEVQPWFDRGVTVNSDGTSVVIFDNDTELNGEAYRRITRFDLTYTP